MSANDRKKSEQDERKPVVLSKDEALYPPSKKALRTTVIAIVIAIIVAVAVFVFFPLPQG